MSDLTLWQSLDGELATMAEHFSSLVRASRIPDEDSEASTALAAAGAGGRGRAPGDLLEVWAEKLLYSAFTCLHVLSELKKGAMVSDFTALMENVRGVRQVMDGEETAAARKMADMRTEAQELLGELETSYYASRHRGRPTGSAASPELQQLCQLALEAPSDEQQPQPQPQQG